MSDEIKLLSGLECRVGRAPVAVPVERIAQIIEYETTPLPLARRSITGVGLHAGGLVVTIGLANGSRGAAARAVRHHTKGILLRVPGAEIGWALEVQKVLLLVKATIVEGRKAAPAVDELPPWIVRATTEDGRSIGWIDVPVMIASLTADFAGGPAEDAGATGAGERRAAGGASPPPVPRQLLAR